MTSELTSIERTTLIRAPRSRVWRALTDSKEFSTWFSVDMAGPLVPGERVEFAPRKPCGTNRRYYLIVEKMESEHTFSWRWHPGAAEVNQDQVTHVEFHLAEVEGGTLVTVIETGFDGILLARRARAFEENQHGWQVQLDSLAQYVHSAA